MKRCFNDRCQDLPSYPINNPTRFTVLVGVESDAGPENDGFVVRLFLSFVLLLPPLLLMLVLNLNIPDIFHFTFFFLFKLHRKNLIRVFLSL